MALQVIPLLTTITDADSAAAGWTSAMNNEDGDNFIQGIGAIGEKVSNGTTTGLFDTGAPTLNLQNQHLYAWVNSSTATLLDTYALGGIRIRVTGANTNNYGEWDVAGKDTYGGGWRCFVVDCNRPYDRPGGTPPPITAIQYVGVTFVITAVVKGNFNNCLIDAIRYGSGLRIVSGSVNSPGTFADIYATSSLNANAYGVIGKIADGVYTVQGQLLFGSASAQPNVSVFRDKNLKLFFQDAKVSGSLYKIKVESSSAWTSSFQLGDRIGTGSDAIATNTCLLTSITGSLGLSASRFAFEVTGSNQNVKLYGTEFNRAQQIKFGSGSNTGLLPSGSIELVDNTFVDTQLVWHSISSGSNLLNNKIVRSANITSSMLLGVNGVDSSQFEFISSRGFSGVGVSQSFSSSNYDPKSKIKDVVVENANKWLFIDPVWTTQSFDFKYTSTTFPVTESYTLNPLISHILH